MAISLDFYSLAYRNATVFKTLIDFFRHNLSVAENSALTRSISFSFSLSLSLVVVILLATFEYYLSYFYLISQINCSKFQFDYFLCILLALSFHIAFWVIFNLFFAIFSQRFSSFCWNLNFISSKKFKFFNRVAISK